MPTRAISDILGEVERINWQRKDRKIDLLRKYDSPTLRIVLQMAFDPDLKWALPYGPVEYKKNENIDMWDMNLQSIARKLYVFLDPSCGGSNLKPDRMKTLFVQYLEALPTPEAELLCMMKDGMVTKGKGIWPGLIREAFPGLLSETRRRKNKHKDVENEPRNEPRGQDDADNSENKDGEKFHEGNVPEGEQENNN